MKAIVKTAAIVVALAIPALSSAQTSNGPMTREQVRAQLIQLEQAGYNPARGNRGTYPAEIQAAQARVAAKNNGMSDTSATGVGGTATGTAEAGHLAPMDTPTMMPNRDTRSMFGHH
jgi:hypothetical protein